MFRLSPPSALGREGQTIAVCRCVASAPPLTISDNCRTLVPNRHVPLAKETRHSHSFGASIRTSLAIRLLCGHVRSVGAPGIASCSFVALGVRRGLESSPGPSPPTCLYPLVVNPAAIFQDRLAVDAGFLGSCAARLVARRRARGDCTGVVRKSFSSVGS